MESWSPSEEQGGVSKHKRISQDLHLCDWSGNRVTPTDLAEKVLTAIAIYSQTLMRLLVLA